MRSLFLSVSLSALLVLSPVSAQDSRYQSWSDPDASQTQSRQGLVEDLRRLISEAEKARAADPVFLSDLRALANKYDPTTMSLILEETFADGDFTRNPAWQVASGKYWIEKGYGLRTVVEPADPANAGGQTKNDITKEEVVIGILGAVLGARSESGSSGRTSAPATNPQEPAEIFLSRQIPNSFKLELTLTSWKPKGDLAIGTFQGGDRQSGYRLYYRAGQTPALELVRKYGSRTSVIADVADVDIQDQKAHTLVWTRKPGGVMTLSLDGTVLLETTDQGFRDPFSGLKLVNRQGDFTFGSVKISGL